MDREKLKQYFWFGVRISVISYLLDIFIMKDASKLFYYLLYIPFFMGLFIVEDYIKEVYVKRQKN